MHAIQRDIRHALRMLRRAPGFTAVAVFTLALGIGASTSIFSVINGVLLRPLPYPEPDELVRVWQVGDQGGRMNFSHPNFEDIREQSRTFEALAEYAWGIGPVESGGEPERVGYAVVSGDFFEVLGVRPVLGRVFQAMEREATGAPVAVVSHGYWQRALGGDRDLSNRTLTSDDRVYAVVGVLPPGFEFQDGTDVFIPQTLRENPSRTAHNWRVLGRLTDGATLAQARQELSAIARRLKADHGDDTWMVDAHLAPLHEDLVGDARPVLLILLGAAACLLLIACANVVNLLLSRLATRQRELAVRQALGAGRRRLVQQFLVESLVLALAGGAVGVLLAFWGVDVLLALEPGRLPRAGGIRVDAPVLGFALGASVLTAVAIGLVMAYRSTRSDVRESLAASQRTSAGGLASHRVRGALVASQVALTLVLLAGAGLLLRSFQRVLAVDPGYRTEGAVLLDVWLPSTQGAAARARAADLYAELIRRLEAVPGVERVGGVSAFPLLGGGANGMFLIVDDPGAVADFDDWRRIAGDSTRTGYAEYRAATGDYFGAMGIPLVRGRLFDERDDREATHVAVISESLAKQRWPGEDPIGKQVVYANMDGIVEPMTIVGIVGDVRDWSLEAEPRPTFYGNAFQRTSMLGGTFNVVAQGRADPGTTIAAARRILDELAPAAPVRFRTLDDVFSASLADRRFSLLLLGVFAATALLLAAAGLYGVVSYLVAQRTQEVGVRMALGARPGDVLRLMVGEAVLLAGLGVGFGILAALGLTRFLSGMLYGVGAVDPVTFAAIALLLGGVALLASYVPARRATKIDPMVTVRAE